MFEKLLLLVAAALLSAGCDDRPNQWDAYIYQDVENMDSVELIRGFKTFELCQAAAINRLQSTPGDGDYKCGYKCGPNEEYGGMNMCKETRK
ncbi:MAG: hypothetical protein C0429_18180 [Sphingopyxis sp.]|nr:hypothetical protein [Sphingopyxis sp.]